MDWLEMAEDEFKDCESDYRDGSYLSAVYPIEQCSQKAIKAVIVTLGFDPGKTHMPTIVLKLLIAGGLVDLKKTTWIC